MPSILPGSLVSPPASTPPPHPPPPGPTLHPAIPPCSADEVCGARPLLHHTRQGSWRSCAGSASSLRCCFVATVGARRPMRLGSSAHDCRVCVCVCVCVRACVRACVFERVFGVCVCGVCEGRKGGGRHRLKDNKFTSSRHLPRTSESNNPHYCLVTYHIMPHYKILHHPPVAQV